MMRGWLAGLLLALLVLGGGTTAPRAADAGVDTGPPPASLVAALPAGARVEASAPVRLMDGAAERWAVIFSLPVGSSPFARSSVAAIFAPDGEGWAEVYRREEEFAVGGSLLVRAVDGEPAVAFFSFVGAHAQGVTLVRWDGQGFVEVLRTGSNTPGIGLDDLDGDGTPEVIEPWSPYCGSYASSPLLVHVYAWDGAVYGDATGRFPALLAGFAEDVRAAIDSGRESTADGLACLHTALAWLSWQISDEPEVAAACAAARAAAPAYRAAWAAAVCA